MTATKEEIKTVPLKKSTKEKLDNVMINKGIEAMREDPDILNKFVSAFVKNKRGVTYDKAVNFLIDFYSVSLELYKKSPDEEKEKSQLNEVITKVGKMNGLF